MQESGKLGKLTVIGYCSPSFFIATTVTAAMVVLPTLYAQHTAVTLAQIGLILMVARMLDAFTDPLIGYLSDNTKTRWGGRKPWIAAGAVTLIPAIWFLFHPTAESDALYFLTWAFFYTLGSTMILIPGGAWGVELTRNPKERARIFTIRGMLTYIGSITYAVLPILLFKRYGSTALSLDVMGDLALLTVIALPFSFGLMLLVVPKGKPVASKKASLTSVWKTIRSNRLLWRYFAVMTFTGLGIGMYYGVMFLFFVDYMKMGQGFPFIAITNGVAVFLAMPVWMKLVNRYGKARVWLWALLVSVPVSPMIWFISPGMESLIPVLGISVLGACVLAGHFTVSPILLSDIVDYDTLRSGANKAGNIFSASLIVTKAAYAGGTGLALMLVGLFGYRMGVDNDASAIFGLAFSFSILPAVLFALGGIALLRYPMTSRKQDIIRRRLEQRVSRLKTETTQAYN
ncbi:MFS transporter [Emcibacter nanhaiensis]|uniref:MFS transporter n=1 Tax=Emcibacter nanhaiensis TaxID=1505037 RepID=A0A501PHF1_9PROT|nr:MFS transporter [Emcibacter nanhaiensis]TPD59276.1 MFS transporter [Emcibacter nanhaiensis]